jgi:hypothetical protein
VIFYYFLPQCPGNCRRKVEPALNALRRLAQKVNGKNMKYMFMYRHQNEGLNYKIKIYNPFLKNCGNVKIFENSSNKTKLHLL